MKKIHKLSSTLLIVFFISSFMSFNRSAAQELPGEARQILEKSIQNWNKLYGTGTQALDWKYEGMIRTEAQKAEVAGEITEPGKAWMPGGDFSNPSSVTAERVSDDKSISGGELKQWQNDVSSLIKTGQHIVRVNWKKGLTSFTTLCVTDEKTIIYDNMFYNAATIDHHSRCFDYHIGWIWQSTYEEMTRGKIWADLNVRCDEDGTPHCTNDCGGDMTAGTADCKCVVRTKDNCCIMEYTWAWACGFKKIKFEMEGDGLKFGVEVEGYLGSSGSGNGSCEECCPKPKPKPVIKQTPKSGSTVVPSSTRTRSQDGLTVVSGNFPGDQKTTFTAYVPEFKKGSLSSGVTFSGSVITEGDDRAPGEFRGRVIATDDNTGEVLASQDINSNKESFRLLIPAGVAAVTLFLADPSGTSEPVANLPVFEMPDITSFVPAKNFTFPENVLQGEISNITGPFDGISGNTGLLAGDNKLFPLAESPGQLFFTVPADYSGSTNITVKEGQQEASAEIRVVGLDFYAPTTVIKRGDEVNLRLTSFGLKELEQPVVVHIQNHTESVISMSGGNDQLIVITPLQVGTSDSYVNDIRLNGLSQGSFSIMADIKQIPASWWSENGFNGVVTPSLTDALWKYIKELEKTADKIRQVAAEAAKKAAEAVKNAKKEAQEAKIKELEEQKKELEEKIKESKKKAEELKKAEQAKKRELEKEKKILKLLKEAKDAGENNRPTSKKRKLEEAEKESGSTLGNLDREIRAAEGRVSEKEQEAAKIKEEQQKEQQNQADLKKELDQTNKDLAKEKAAAAK